jgi:replication-associated recombination protein RarA
MSGWAAPRASWRWRRRFSTSRWRPSRTRLRRLQGGAGEAKKTGSEPPPKHILNAPTKLMKEQGYGAGYAYDHDAEDGFSGRTISPTA